MGLVFRGRTCLLHLLRVRSTSLRRRRYVQWFERRRLLLGFRRFRCWELLRGLHRWLELQELLLLCRVLQWLVPAGRCHLQGMLGRLQLGGLQRLRWVLRCLRLRNLRLRAAGAAAGGFATPATRVRKLGELAVSRERNLRDTDELLRVTREEWAEEEKAHKEKVAESDRVHKDRIARQHSTYYGNEGKLAAQSDLLRDEEERVKLMLAQKAEIERSLIAEEDRLRAAKLRNSQLESEQKFLQSRLER